MFRPFLTTSWVNLSNSLKQSKIVISGTTAAATKRITTPANFRLPIAHTATTIRNMATHATNTSKYKLNHTMVRVKDPKKSLEFYQFLGMKQIERWDFDKDGYSLYFLAYDGAHAESSGNSQWDREGVLELTHNHGTENDDSYKSCNGNKDEGKGYGHIAISVDNIEAACKRLEDNGVRFQKKLKDGRMKTIAFALDPDDYWVEIVKLNNKDTEKAEKDNTTDPQTYRLNHTMIRVKDAEKSLDFYRQVMGMSLLRTSVNEDAKFNLYFLGYRRPHETTEDEKTADREGLLELTWNYGTEKDDDFKGYHSGNTEPKGFGHICVSVDDIEAACARFDDLRVTFKKKLTDGRMKDVAFVLDPDG